MITNIAIENVRGVSRQIGLAPEGCAKKVVIDVYGKNGERKSTIADSIAFVFTGSDAFGNPVPLHLISEGKDKMTVVLSTEKATITRSLTRKKTQTFKMQRAGQPIATDLTQEQMSKLIGSKDAFLSSFMSGYFMYLPDERRMKVLQEFVPPVDKFALIEEISGVTLNDTMRKSIPIEKRSDLAKAVVSSTRSQAEKKLSEMVGAKGVYEATQPPGAEPKKPETDVGLIRQRAEAWDRFDKLTLNWQQLSKEAQTTGMLWNKWSERLLDLESELALLPEIPKPTNELYEKANNAIGDNEMAISGLRRPQKAGRGIDLPNTDNCPTCGQVVGTKHRERVAAENQKLTDDHEAALKEYEGVVQTYRDKIAVLATERENHKAEYKKILERWEMETKARQAALSNIKAHKSVEPKREINLPPAPTEPGFERVSPDVLRNAIEEDAKYKAAHSSWKSANATYNEAMLRKEKLVKDMEVLDALIIYMKKIESAFDKLDQAIFEKNQAYYKFQNHELVVNEGKVSIVRDDGLPYDYMSTGQKVLAGSYLCERLAKAFKVSFIFIDNFDLVSTEPELDCPQVIRTIVTDQEFTVKFA